MKNIETKQLIKNAVFDILTKKVDLPFNMRSIQKVTTLSPGTIYYHYQSKTSIILDLVEDFWKYALSKYNDYEFNDNLINSLKNFYLDIQDKFLFFETYFVPVLNKLTIEDKSIGRNYELAHLNKMKELIEKIIITKEKEINEETITVLGIQRLTDFVYSNFNFSLKLHNDINNYLYIVDKIIHKKGE